MEEYKTTIDELDAPTAKNASQGMRISRMLYLTEGGKPYNLTAREYARKLKGYSIYCIPQMQEEWINHIDKLMDVAGLISDAEFVYYAGDFECAGEMLELMSQNSDWEQIHELVREQGHSNGTISSLSQLLLLYSDRGIEFVDKEIGKALRSFDALRKLYNKTKKLRLKEKETQEKLVLVLRKIRDKKASNQ